MKLLTDIKYRSNEIGQLPRVVEGINSATRLLANLIVSAADLSLLGEALSIGADVMKIGKRFAPKYFKTDLTPNVPISLAVVTEVFEFCSFGYFPSHVIETGLQSWHDLKNGKYRDAFAFAYYVLTGNEKTKFRLTRNIIESTSIIKD